jgi:hypothetical protein
MNHQRIVFSVPPQPDDSNGQPDSWSAGHSTTVALQPADEDPGSQRFRSILMRHFAADIDTKYTDLILILCGFVSGLVDGLSFNAWGSFASMQTGS